MADDQANQIHAAMERAKQLFQSGQISADQYSAFTAKILGDSSGGINAYGGTSQQIQFPGGGVTANLPQSGAPLNQPPQFSGGGMVAKLPGT